ncbi:DNA primase [Gracilinema caldarium]|uniref:DNA primase n=1 Tax=Gracilinema caldarium (strain ATCC 51460 / DSM 7334 / H1) TaxID=744872 RepID=F8F3G3_GRAC1|nr:DNA primase [Gracilinema caldarium]AEJ19539.1 DNA primase [Gracilinema caldarium DSM 7334]
MSFISEETIQEIQQRADAVSIIGEYVRLEKKGGRYWGLCPFHNEKTPSFSVDPEKNFFYCFGCHKGGGIISFVMEQEKLSYPETLELLAKKLNITVKYEAGSSSLQETNRMKQLEDMAELYRRVAVSFHHILTATEAGKKAFVYLKERGISDEMINTFRLGYAPAHRHWLYRFLLSKGYSEDFLEKSGLFSRQHTQSSFFTDRLIFPISDRKGRTVAFGGRILQGDGPKYLNSPESDLYKKRETLYAIELALPHIRKTEEVHICEGYMDVIALHQAGVQTAVAPLGTAFTDEQARLLRQWAKTVYLVFDNDPAGQAATIKGILTCRRNGLGCKIVTMEKIGAKSTIFKDPADILKEDGPEALQNYVKCFINDFDYLVGRARALFDTTHTEGLAQAVAFFFPYLETLDSEVSRDGCMGAIADSFGVDRTAIVRDFNQYFQKGVAVHQSYTEKKLQSKAPIRMNDELFLLLAIIANRSLYPRLRASLSIEEVEDPRAKDLFIALEECYRNDIQDIDGLLVQIQDEELRRFILEKASSEAFSQKPEQLVSDGIKRIRAKRLERRRAEIILRLRSARTGSRQSEQQIEELLSEKVHIDAELHRLKED